MDDKLVPAHIHFARWFIRLRWFAIVLLIAANLTVRHLFDVPIIEMPIYIITIILLFLNIFHSIIIKKIKYKGGPGVVQKIKKDIDLQIVTDLILLTLILHYSGGIENPLILFYFFHLIIASSIFSTLKSYLYTIFAIFLVALLVFLEYFSIIPHYNLTGFAGNELHNNAFYIFGTGFVFLLTAITIVSLSHLIIYRSIKSEEGYVKANMELENKDKLKNEYVLRVTHDIKGHVAAIFSCLEVIRSGVAGPMNEVQKDFVNRAFNRTGLLSEFVKNLLSLTRKRLKRDTEFEEIFLKDLIGSIVRPLRQLASDKKIRLQVFTDKALGNITCNPYSLEELYSNLLLNAIKYTPENGNITLEVKSHGTHVMTRITDTGIGIPKEEIHRVFDEFYRGTNVPKDINTGSGLGLSIAKQIVENHKGKIWVSSEPGAWTRFTFILPVSQPENPKVIL
ncbi:MAG TPA: HAMP domain-containing sensor histidine kinase [Bacteroidales bacterium]|nr:HAMP domain-containing sensor histidine kinase [Bacteroidales bacterium]